MRQFLPQGVIRVKGAGKCTPLLASGPWLLHNAQLPLPTTLHSTQLNFLWTDALSLAFVLVGFCLCQYFSEEGKERQRKGLRVGTRSSFSEY